MTEPFFYITILPVCKQFTPLSKTCVVGVVGVANLCEIDYSQFKWDLVVWRQVSSHQKTCAITLQSKVVTQRLQVLHADPLYDHLTTITTCS